MQQSLDYSAAHCYQTGKFDDCRGNIWSIMKQQEL